MTQEEIAEVSVAVAARVGRRRGIDRREILGAVWIRVSQAAAKGGGVDLFRAGMWAYGDYMRVERPLGYKRNQKELGSNCQFGGGHEMFDGRGDRLVYDREYRPPVEHRLEELWAETRRNRAHVGLLSRVIGYLCYVCGWSQQEVADFYGVTLGTVHYYILDLRTRALKGGAA